MHRARLLPGLCAFAAVSAIATASHAFERQWHLGADLGWSAVSHKTSIDGQERIFGGYGAGGHLVYGLNDTFNAMLEVGVSGHPIYSNRPWMTVASGAAGVSYTLDILRWVPYAGLLVGGYHFSAVGHDKAETKLGFQLALGLDYAFNRSWAMGVQLRYHTFADDPFSAHYMTTFGRFEYRWGW
ncbi:MAG: outer membrane beta-barrel protein [Deltaproteobacteria bacterium]|nr:outer membrane beta-barrel protein [Deltaproteobacteria bacterium]